jgi:hypothetical protein
VITCRVCGTQLPPHARFCARCGTAQPVVARGVAAWVLVVFGLGVAVSALGSIVYAVVAIDPSSAAGTNIDHGLLRAAAVSLAVALAALCGLQVAAVAGLIGDREWGRVTATVACVAWALTCVGLPVSILVLNSIGRRRPPATRLA